MIDINGAISAELQRYIDEAVAARGSIPDAVAAYMHDHPIEAPQIDQSAIEEAIAIAVANAIDGLPTPEPVSDPVLSNPLTHGADPTCTLDSGPAFVAAAKATGRIQMPADGKFLIDGHYELPYRTVWKGQSFSHFGNGNAQIYRGPNVPADEPMFSNVYWVEGVAFSANGNGGTGIDMEGYCCRTIGCTFNGFDIAQTCPAGTHDLFYSNQYTSCDTGIKNTEPHGEQATCMSFIHNQFHYVKNPIDYEGIYLFNGRIRDNVFERVSGNAIHVGYMRECTIDNNWWEHRTEGVEANTTFTIDRANQCWGNIIMGSHTQAGWIDYFDRDPADAHGMAGTIGFIHERLQIADNTDGGVVLDKDGLHGKVSLSGDASRPFDIESGRAAQKQKSQTLRLRSRYKVEINGGRGFDIKGHSDDQADESMRYPIRVCNGQDTYHGLGLNYGAHGTVKPQLAGLATVKGQDALIGVPAHAYVTNGDDAVGMGLFSAVEFTDTSVTLTLPFPIETPMIQVTTVDGSSHSGITLKADGFTIAFDEGVPPFWLSFMSIPKGMA